MNPKVSVGGAVLTIVGGVFILLVGAAVAYLFAALFGGLGRFVPGFAGILILGPVLGLLVIIVGVLEFAAPELKVVWGALAIIFSVASIFSSAVGGLFLGFILALVGGILILVHSAPPPPMMMGTPMAPPMGTPMAAPMGAPGGAGRCPYCGGVVDPNTHTCTSCGKTVA